MGGGLKEATKPSASPIRLMPWRVLAREKESCPSPWRSRQSLRVMKLMPLLLMMALERMSKPEKVMTSLMLGLAIAMRSKSFATAWVRVRAAASGNMMAESR
ncbi:hypothetical protein D3C80_688040 [compost metagenome]